ncbi:MAG: CDP-glucose 4,6-dehydratase [Pseudomonadota bacterium]|uniref:CDP-glucose 4,6-dehydratase n=1 Tax=Roseovarius sp. TaxID=1486281 RepID=UPI00356758A2
MLDADFWRDKRVFLTGHTGFKGGWTARWLHMMGASIHGYSLAPESAPNLFDLAGIADICASSTIADIRDRGRLQSAIFAAEPDVVLHYAAQPLVVRGYLEPAETFDINVMGSVHLLEAVRRLGSRTVCIMVTSDKCYENPNDGVPLPETAAMGGADPYSASKGAAEIAIASWIRSFMSASSGPVVASVRAGNVIGGGDWAAKRLLPDAMRAFSCARPLEIRNPLATRPWQHVLEPVSGYLRLAETLAADRPIARHFNFGPDPDQIIPVHEVADIACTQWGDGARWVASDDRQDWEEGRELVLDISRAARDLGWRPRLSTSKAVQWTIDWWRVFLDAPGNLPGVCDAQIRAYRRD